MANCLQVGCRIMKSLWGTRSHKRERPESGGCVPCSRASEHQLLKIGRSERVVRLLLWSLIFSARLRGDPVFRARVPIPIALIDLMMKRSFNLEAHKYIFNAWQSTRACTNTHTERNKHTYTLRHPQKVLSIKGRLTLQGRHTTSLSHNVWFKRLWVSYAS